MSFSIEAWMRKYCEEMKKQFENRIWFIGLQGSYGRGEATEQSDIDVVLILDKITYEDLRTYSSLLEQLPNREKICGFVSGKEELLAWEPSDLFQFYYDTEPVEGTLEPLMERIRKEDILRAIHTGACNVYHMCVHNLIHEKSSDILKNLYKSAVFTLQAIAFWQTGKYFKKKKDLELWLQPEDRRILKNGMELKKKETLSAEKMAELSEELLDWASGWLRQCGGKRGRDL